MTDVVVVGAGLSGLIAARELHRKGIDVTVLEAAERLGGRALSQTSAAGSRLDLGGQWIGHDHHRLAALVDELGATRFRMHTGVAPTLVGAGPPAIAVAAGALAALSVLRKLERAPRKSRVRDWINHVPGRARRLLEVAAAVSWTADPGQFSVRTMMSLIEHQGGLKTMLSTRGGAQDSLITEGVGYLVDRVAEGLTIQTGVEVTAIERGADQVLVRTTNGTVRAKRVIVTTAPPIAARIAHDPPLPPQRQALEADTFMGSVYKAIAVYPEPFWRRQSTGEFIFLDRPGFASFDTSAPDGPGHLCLLVGGPDALLLDALPSAERRAALLARVATKLGIEAMSPLSWHEKSWHLDPHVGGGYIALPKTGTIPFAAEPIGPLHWAGAETASDHPGYLDGAIEAGERAAAEVAAAL